MKRANLKKWAKPAVVVAVFAILLVLPQPIQHYTAWGQGYGYGEPPPPTTGGGTSAVTTAGGVFTQTTTFTSHDKNLTVNIPRNTVGKTEAGDPLAEVRITAVSVAPDPPQDMGFIGLSYDLEPDGATFDPPINLIFTYNPNWIPAGLDPENLTIGYYDEDTEQWVMLDAKDITVNPATNTISAKISHFTYYSVMARTAPAKFMVSNLSISPTTVEVAAKATISAVVANSGDLSGTYRVTLKINGKEVSSKRLEITGGESKTVSFETVQGSPGSYKIDINGLSGTLTVKEAVVKPVVITSTVPSISAPAVEYPAPTAPAPPAVPTPVPAPTPWLAIIISLVATAVVAIIIIWYYGFRTQ